METKKQFFMALFKTHNIFSFYKGPAKSLHCGHLTIKINNAHLISGPNISTKPG